MIRDIAVFMISVLFFNMALYALPESLTVKDQAKVDAKADFNEGNWALLGAFTPLGCCVGFGVASIFAPEPANSAWITMSITTPNETQFNGAYIGAAIGCLTLPLSIALTPINPPPERLLGKPPEYISAYTREYKRETQQRRITSAGSGALIGAGLGCLISLIAFQNAFPNFFVN